MSHVRSRSVAAFAAFAAWALIVSACGGGDDDASSEGEIVESADGVLTVQVPDGAALDGVEVSIAALEDGDLPSELQETDAVVVGYELSPDGAEFSEPLTVTFRLDPGDIGLELSDAAVPLGLLLTQNAAGELESLRGAELSRDGDQIVAQVAVTHFSPAIVVITDELMFELSPAKLELQVGESWHVLVTENSVSVGEEPEWKAISPLTARATQTDHVGEIRCTAPTDGWVTGAYTALVELGSTDSISGSVVAAVFQELNIFDVERALPRITLSGDGKCNAPEETPTPSASSPDDGGSSSVELNAANAAGQASGDISGAAGGCEDQLSQEADCVPHIDITGVRWGPVEGAPNLVEVGVTLGGTPPADSSADYTVTVKGTERGSGTPIVQEQLRALSGELTCESFRGGEPGEACQTPAQDQFVITVDISKLTPPLEIELFSLQGTSDGRIGDHYVVEDIGE